MTTRTPRAADGPALDRRTLLVSAAAGAGTLTLLALAGCVDPARRLRVRPTAPPAPPRSLTQAEWRAFEAAQDRLLPSQPGSPGARDVNAIGYLDAALLEPDTDPETRVLVRDGAARLDRIARSAGGADFADLAPDRRDEALRTLRTVDGSATWFAVMLQFTLEAFLGDPVHGGNTGEVGWKWAGHEPGVPRPEPGRKARAG